MTAKKGMPRRKALLTLGGVAASGAILAKVGEMAVGRTAAFHPRPARPRTLALLGDRYHNADAARVAFLKLFKDLDLPFDYTMNYEKISAAMLRDFDLFMVLRDGLIWPEGYLEPNDYEYSHDLENVDQYPKEHYSNWITTEQGEAIRDFVASGKSLYSVHNSSNISVSSPAYREVMGGAYIGHPPLRPFLVRVKNSDHPLTRGIKDFMVNDEQHFVDYDKDPKYILLESENIDGLTFGNHGTKCAAGWAYDYKQGRVAFTAVGHTLRALWQPEQYQLMQNAVRWLLRLS